VLRRTRMSEEMRHPVRRFNLFLTALVFLSILAAQSATAKRKPPSVSIEISVPNMAVRAGSELTLIIRVTNISRHDSGMSEPQLMEGRVDPYYKYDGRNGTGDPVGKEYPVLGSLGDHPIPPIKPGEQRKEAIVIGRACDLSLSCLGSAIFRFHVTTQKTPSM
jgi:hypothetical protein